MISFCIKNNNPIIIKYLYENISSLNVENIILSKRNFSKYNNLIIHYTGSNSNMFYNELSNILCDCILIYYEPTIIKNLIHSNYFYFTLDEMNSIEKNCNDILKNSSLGSIERKMCLWCDILKYIISNKSMVLDGFITFRIKPYLKYLDEVVDTAVNQFVIEREYLDFISILKVYIENKKTSGTINLVYINGESTLLDEEKNIISVSTTKFNINYLSDISFSSNDYALNSLLTLLPSQIIIHLITEEDEFINTLKLVFEDRITLCKDCKICQTYKLFQTKQSKK